MLDDVEVIFIHLHSEAEVKEKWKRRVERVNWDNLIFKFSKSNHASDKDCRTFDEMELPRKSLCSSMIRTITISAVHTIWGVMMIPRCVMVHISVIASLMIQNL